MFFRVVFIFGGMCFCCHWPFRYFIPHVLIMEVSRGCRLALEEKHMYCFRGFFGRFGGYVGRVLMQAQGWFFRLHSWLNFVGFTQYLFMLWCRDLNLVFWVCLWFRCLDFMGFGGSPLWRGVFGLFVGFCIWCMDVLLGCSAYIQHICLVVTVLHVSVALNRDLFLINFSVKKNLMAGRICGPQCFLCCWKEWLFSHYPCS